MRLMRAAPRDVMANKRSSATTCGFRSVIACSAASASRCGNSSSSPFDEPARSRRAGSRSAEPMRTTQGSGTAHQYTIAAAMNQLPFRDITLGDLLTRLGRALPDRDAVVYAQGPRWTFRELEREARTIARGLLALGVSPGERVVVWSTNVPEWIVLQFALAKIGAVLVTANTSLRARDIGYLLRQSESATLVTIGGFRDVDYIHELKQVGATTGAIPTLQRIVAVGEAAATGLGTANRPSDPVMIVKYADLRGRAT